MIWAFWRGFRQESAITPRRVAFVYLQLRHWVARHSIVDHETIVPPLRRAVNPEPVDANRA